MHSIHEPPIDFVLDLSSQQAVYTRGAAIRTCPWIFGYRQPWGHAYTKCPFCNTAEHRLAVSGIRAARCGGGKFFMQVQGDEVARRSDADVARDWAMLDPASALIHPDDRLPAPLFSDLGEGMIAADYYDALGVWTGLRAAQPLGPADAHATVAGLVRVGAAFEEFVRAMLLLPAGRLLQTSAERALALAEARAPDSWFIWASAPARSSANN